jgi:hypothetical protein
MTAGIGVWLKPGADWMVTWLPVGLSVVLGCRLDERGLDWAGRAKCSLV